jgi:hypothetical protein
MEPIKRIKVEVLECTCLRCGHVWVPPLRNEEGKWVCDQPRACARCKNFYWDRPREVQQSKGKRGK